MNDKLDIVTQRIVEPLNEKTRRLFMPARVMSNDRMNLTLSHDGKHFVMRVFAVLRRYDSGEEFETTASYGARKFISRIPERKMIRPETAYQIAATDFSVLVINAAWPHDQLTMTPGAATVYNWLLVRFLGQTESAKIYSDFKVKGIEPTMPNDFIDHPDYPLATFQKVPTAAQIFQSGNLWMEQGTGKTPIVIARVNYEAHVIYEKEKRPYRALIVVPKNVRSGWMKKFCQFAIHPGKLTVLRGGQLTRVKQLVEAFKRDEDSEYTVIIASYETVIKTWDAIRLIEWDLVTLDEAHMIKSDRTRRWKYMKELREKSENRTGLTGTPFGNKLWDMWTQLEWLGEGMSGFLSFKNFKKYYGKFVRDASGQRDIHKGYQNLPILQERITRLCYITTRAEALPHLPKKSYDEIEVNMSKQQAEFYMKLRDQLMIEIEAELKNSEAKGKQLVVTNILTKLLRLSQITAGYVKWDPVYTDEGELVEGTGTIEFFKENPKADAVIDFIKSTGPKEKVILWCCWIPALKLLSERLNKAGIKHVLYYGSTKDAERDEAERSYNNDPTVKVFLGNPAAGGVGLDLWGYNPLASTEDDHGCNTRYVLYYAQDWSMIKRTQSEDRAVRRGTRAPVQIIDVLVPGSIDVEISMRVLEKKLTAMAIQDVRAVMERIANIVPGVNDD